MRFFIDLPIISQNIYITKHSVCKKYLSVMNQVNAKLSSKLRLHEEALKACADCL